MDNESKPTLAVWWILWVAFQTGIVVMYFLLGKSATVAPDATPGWLVALAPVLISTVLRWAVLPRVSKAEVALPIFVAGLALAEMTCLLGLFVFPQHRQDLLFLSVLGLLQYVPHFARRYFPEKG